MIIENIKKKNSTNANLFILTTEDGEYVFHSDIIVKYALTKNIDIENEKFKKIKFESDCLICFNLVTKYISSSVKSTKQIRDYLKKKGYEKEVITSVLNKLIEYKIVDDKIYTECVIRSEKSRKSKSAIKTKLLSQGISREEIDESLENLDDFEVCLKTAKKFLKSRDMTNENIQKLLRHLSYKGFSYETISKTLKELKMDIDN